MSKAASNELPHRRYNPLKQEWVLVSPHRNKRPWQGRSEDQATETKPAHDPSCYLCAGNERANGAQTPNYAGPYVFPNDFPALLADTAEIVDTGEPLMRAEAVKGTARVICFSERHDLTLPEMEAVDIEKVVDVWVQQASQLGRKYQWVAVFENKGTIMGCSNPHPHGQIWASDFIPNEVLREDASQLEHLEKTGKNLLCSYAGIEEKNCERLVVSNKHWVAVVPFWATWPYETMLMPRRHVLRLDDLSNDERQTLAEILKRLCTRYDNLFQTEFPYTMGWHGAPYNGAANDHWQLHAHFYPPLLRSATVRKFMVGYEMLAEAQRDLTAETAAEQLRALSDTHYKKSMKGT